MRIVDGVRDPTRLSPMTRTLLLEAHSESVYLEGRAGRLTWVRRSGR